MPKNIKLAFRVAIVALVGVVLMTAGSFIFGNPMLGLLGVYLGVTLVLLPMIYVVAVSVLSDK